MKKPLGAMIFTVAAIGIVGTAEANKNHFNLVPSGSNAHTITVGEPSLSAHLRHGDTQGACGTVSQLDPCDLTSNLAGCVATGIYY